MAAPSLTSAPIAPLSLTAAKQASPSSLSPSALIAAASHSYLASVSQLTGGISMLKFPFSDKGGKPERRFLFYAVDDIDGDCLYWSESDKRKKRNNGKCVPLRDVTGLLEGWQTAPFRRAMEDRRLGREDEGSCFSIVGKKRTLDLQANSREERDRFIAAIHCVMTHKQLNLKQQATAVATARRQSIINTQATTAALSSPNSPLAAPLHAAAAVAASSPTAARPTSDMFVISVKARNLPIMPWRDDDGNDTLVVVYAKTTATGGQFALVESSEWQHSNAMPNFRTPLLVPIQLPILPSDLIKLVAYDSADDDAHVIGSVVVRAEFFMKNAGHEMMVKLKNSAQPPIEQLLTDSNTYLLLTSTCKTGGGGGGGGGGGAGGKAAVNVATKQQFGSVMAEFQSALQKGTAPTTVAATASTASAANTSDKPAHARSKSAAPHRGSLVGGRPVGKRPSVSIKPAAHQQLVDVASDTRPRQSSIQLPKTTMSFLQAGDVFTFYPPKKGCSSLKRPIDAPCKVRLALRLRGDFGVLQLRQEREDDSDEEEEEEVEGGDESSGVLLSVPFELVYQAKLGTAPGCFYLPTLTHRRPKPARCLSLLIKTTTSADAKIDYWLDLECRTGGTRDAWVQAVGELTAYIHMPVQSKPRRGSSSRAQTKQAIEVDSIASNPTSPVSSAAVSPALSPRMRAVKEEREGELSAAQKTSEQKELPASVEGAVKEDEVKPRKPSTAQSGTQPSATAVAEQEADQPGARRPSSIAPAHWDDHLDDTQSDAIVFVNKQPTTSTTHSTATHRDSVDTPFVRFNAVVTSESDSSALSFLDPLPAKRSPLDLARKTAQKGVSNILHPTTALPPVTAPASSILSNIPILPATPVVSIAPPASTKADEQPTDNIVVRPLDLPEVVLGADSDNVPAAPAFDGPPPPPGPPGPPSAPGLTTAHNGPRLKRLHWYAVDGDGLEGTVWREEESAVDGGQDGGWQVGVDGQEMLVSLFAMAEGKVGGSKRRAEEGATRRSIFDSKRNQNIEIALRAFRMPHAALHEAVMSMDMTILNQERLASLIACCPTTEELSAMAAWQAKQSQPIDYSLLPAAEQFTFVMQSIPRYQLRLRAMLFRLRYGELVDGLVKQFNRLSRACRAVRGSSQFRRVLRLILSIGNVMNRSFSVGFHLTSLDELQRTKSADGQTNLVDFIVRYLRLKQKGQEGSEVERDDGAVVGYMADMAAVVHSVCVIDVQQLLDDRAAVTLGLAEMQQQLTTMQADLDAADPSAAHSGDAFIDQMNEFIDEATPRMQRLHESYQLFTNTSTDVLSYLNEVGELSVGEVFQVLDRFCQQLWQAEQRYVERRKAEVAGKHRRVQTVPVAASLSVVLSNVSVQDAMRAHAEKRKESTWDD